MSRGRRVAASMPVDFMASSSVFGQAVDLVHLFFLFFSKNAYWKPPMSPTDTCIARDKYPDSYSCVGWTNDARLSVVPSFIRWLVA